MDAVSYFVNPQTLTLLATSCALLLYWYIFRWYGYWKRRNIPYAKPVFYGIGNLGFLMRKSVTKYFLELKRSNPTSCVGLFLCWKPALVIQSPELAKKVLMRDVEHFQDRFLYSGYSDPMGSLNLFTVKNPIWSEMRHQMSPIFTSSKLRSLTDLMNFNAKELVQKIERDIKKKEYIHVKETFLMYTSDNVGYSAFGLRVSALNDSDSPLWFITNHMVNFTFWRGLEFSMVFFMPAIANVLRLKIFSNAATEYIRQLFWSVVKERQHTRTMSDKDVVNHMLKLKETMKLPAGSDSQLADNLMLAQVALFILGAIETSSATLTYCLHELAHHPDEQEKLYNEINDALTRNGKDILEYDDLLELKYLSACIYETLRKYPPVPYLDRICNKTYKLTDTITVEKGVAVFVNVVGLHYDERYFPEPEQWRPDRTLPSTDNDNLHFTYLPFGGGPRSCIGMRYGMMQVRAALAQVVHKFKVEPGPGPYEVESDPYSLILSPKNGGLVKFVQR